LAANLAQNWVIGGSVIFWWENFLSVECKTQLTASVS